MNYTAHYNNLIKRAIARKKPDGYFEKHHIIPRCRGGTDDKENIANLTASEHYVAHQLLVKMYPDDRKLIYAVSMLNTSSKGQLRNNKQYKWIKEKVAKALSDRLKGVPLKKQHKENISKALKGKKIPEERKLRISSTLKGKNYITEEGRKKISELHKNKVVSESTRLKSSIQIKKINVEITCPWCKKTGKLTGMKSWHFDRCKENPNGLPRVVDA